MQLSVLYSEFLQIGDLYFSVGLRRVSELSGKIGKRICEAETQDFKVLIWKLTDSWIKDTFWIQLSRNRSESEHYQCQRWRQRGPCAGWHPACPQTSGASLTGSLLAKWGVLPSQSVEGAERHEIIKDGFKRVTDCSWKCESEWENRAERPGLPITCGWEDQHRACEGRTRGQSEQEWGAGGTSGLGGRAAVAQGVLSSPRRSSPSSFPQLGCPASFYIISAGFFLQKKPWVLFLTRTLIFLSHQKSSQMSNNDLTIVVVKTSAG